MAITIRCKRIISGKAYNTETAALLGVWESDELPIEQSLFKTRFGAYFLYTLTQYDCAEHIEPLEPQAAQKWMEEHCDAGCIEAEFGEMPEAGDPEARITLRIPETLRRRALVVAQDRNQSLNALLLRCIERAVSEGERING